MFKRNMDSCRITALTTEQVARIFEYRQTGWEQFRIAQHFDVSVATLRSVIWRAEEFGFAAWDSWDRGALEWME